MGADAATRSGSWIAAECEPGLVSVVIPAYNRAGLIAPTLESLYAQSYRPVEAVVVDDGSTDDTRGAVQRCAEARDTDGLTVRVVRQENAGAQAARNRGCREARGEFLQFLDSDDVLGRDKLSRQVECLSREGRHVDVAYGDALIVQERPDGTIRKTRTHSMGPVDDMVAALLLGTWNPNFSYLARRSAVMSTGEWDLGLKVNQDLDYFLRMAVGGARFAYVPVQTGSYRRHAGARIHTRRAVIRLRATLAVLARAERDLVRTGGMTPRRAAALADYYLRLGRSRFHVDRRLFRWAIDKARTLAPAYTPRKKGERVLTALCGAELAEALLMVRKQLTRGLESRGR
jgi:glycosyltransferase involved in cell wall biosynthesis